jgi:hypothetical protein
VAGMKRCATSLLLLSLLYLVPSVGSGKSVRVKYIHKLDENEFVIDMQVNDGDKDDITAYSDPTELKVGDKVLVEGDKDGLFDEGATIASIIDANKVTIDYDDGITKGETIDRSLLRLVCNISDYAGSGTTSTFNITPATEPASNKVGLPASAAVVRLKVTDGLVYEKEITKPKPNHPNLPKLFGLGNFLNDNFQVPAKTWVTLVTTHDKVTPSEVIELMELCFLSKNFMITFKEVETKLNYQWKPPITKTIITKQFFYRSDTDKSRPKPTPP